MLETNELGELEAEDLAEPQAGTTTAPPVKRKDKVALLAGVAVAALLGIGIYVGIHDRTGCRGHIGHRTRSRTAVPTVDVVHPQASAADQEWCCRARPWPSPTRRSMPAPAAI